MSHRNCKHAAGCCLLELLRDYIEILHRTSMAAATLSTDIVSEKGIAIDTIDTSAEEA